MRHQAALLDLTRRYCEPHRRYHNIAHIAELLWRGRECDLSDEQVLAVWYHDAIYDVPSQDNEVRSAAVLPGGYYMLFVVSGGVPSISRMVRVP